MNSYIKSLPTRLMAATALIVAAPIILVTSCFAYLMAVVALLVDPTISEPKE